MKSWTKRQIKQHIDAARHLTLIKQEFHSHILENIGMTERESLEFIKRAYKKHGLVNDDKKEFAIVAFGKNTREVHHLKPESLKLKANTLILLDMWARLPSPAATGNGGRARLPQKNAPYADATFMFYVKSKGKGQKSKMRVKDEKFEEYNQVWKILKKARDAAVNYIKKEVKKGRMPRGLDIDRIAHDIIGVTEYGAGIKHTIGHSLGFDSPHGKFPGINWREYSPLRKNLGYTIEPGIYLEKFGMRTEIDFYLNSQNEMIVTTPPQEEIEIVEKTV